MSESYLCALKKIVAKLFFKKKCSQGKFLLLATKINPSIACATLKHHCAGAPFHRSGF
jgi:hypothetical protein